MSVPKTVTIEQDHVRWTYPHHLGRRGVGKCGIPPPERCFICRFKGTSFQVDGHLTFEHGLISLSKHFVDGEVVSMAPLYHRISTQVPEPTLYTEYQLENGVWVGRNIGDGVRHIGIEPVPEAEYLSDMERLARGKYWYCVRCGTEYRISWGTALPQRCHQCLDSHFRSGRPDEHERLRNTVPKGRWSW